MIEIQQYSHADLPAIRQTLIDTHADAYAEAMDNPFNQRFTWFVDRWGGKSDFACVIGYERGETVGFAYGAPSTPGKEVWRTMWADPPSDADANTFFLSELLVRPAWRKTGASVRLHDALLTARPESLVCLTVDVSHPKVQTMYEAWDYFKVGEDQPFADSPVYAVMVKRLSSART